jgi:hypothetical protein
LENSENEDFVPASHASFSISALQAIFSFPKVTISFFPLPLTSPSKKMAHSKSPMTQTLLCNFSLQLLEVLAQGCNLESFFWGQVDRMPVLLFLIWNIFLQMIEEHTLQCTYS